MKTKITYKYPSLSAGVFNIGIVTGMLAMFYSLAIEDFKKTIVSIALLLTAYCLGKFHRAIILLTDVEKERNFYYNSMREAQSLLHELNDTLKDKL